MKKLNSLFLTLYLFATAAIAQQNVVLIIADDLGTDYLGFYENSGDTAAMPNLRRLVENGVRFTNATANPVCSPTRAGILTGRYSFRTGVGDAVGGTGSSGTLSLTEKTIPLLLEQYQPNIAKANIGKWHLHSGMPTSNYNNPNLLGYDHFEGSFTGVLPDYYNWTKVTNGTASAVTTYATTETVNDAIAWTTAQAANPFFLWLAFNAPHSPFHLPPAGLHSYTNLSGTAQHITQNRELYYKASLEALDHEIGRLLDALEANGQLDDTDIIFVGDNGNPGQVAQNGLTSHAKGTVYQYGTRVPFIVSGPSVANPGRSSNALVNTVDLFATIQELFGNTGWASQIPTDKPVDSRSLLPVLQNECGAQRAWSFTEIFKTTPDGDDAKAIRNQKYKLLTFDVDGHEEFYNLLTDPNETNNLLATTLNAEAQANYNFLSNEMVQLLGNPDNPIVSAWLRNVTGIMGRHYVAGNSTPINDNALANVQSVQYSTNWVYVDATGIPAYITGPFQDGNPSFATEQTGYFRFPLNPLQNTGTPTATTAGNIGAFINGVALFDYRDGVSWNPNTNALCGGPGNPPCPGGMGATQAWNRDAIPAEMDGFDCAKAHPANGNYHHHQNPSAFDLDLVVVSDVCDLYPSDGLYVIDETVHSPLIGFAYDGFPIYGAYGFKNNDGTGGITRIRSGYQLRNITVRTHHANGTDVADGPPISATYPLGYFREDYEFITHTEPEYLDVHNGRFCVTPEYPNGIYCYFATVDANWNSAYPYAVGPTFYGVRSASKVTTINESVTTYNGLPLAATTAVCNVKCFGAATGEITLSVNGGNAPYTFNWGGGITTQNRSGLAVGSYTVTITDATGQTTMQTATVSQPTSGVSAAAVASPVACFGAATGAIQLTTTGGTASYTFLWNDGNTDEDRTAIVAGSYTVTVTDAEGCTTTASQTVAQPMAALAASTTATSVACFGEATGAIQLSATGGTAGYTFLWDDGITSQNRTALAAGTYAATITDANGCVASASQTVAQPSAVLTATMTATDVACFGAATGTVQLSATGGTAGYTFLWNDGNTSQNRTALAAGTYAATITDANGCMASASQTVAQPSAALTATTTGTDVACFGAATGSIELNATGGTAGYTFLWNDGNTSQNLTALAAGTYAATITDANGCEASASQTVEQPNQLTAISTSTDAACNESNGSVMLEVGGGASPYSFNWSNGATQQNLSNLASGGYFVTVSDANGCTLQQAASVNNLGGPAAGVLAVAATCFGAANGSISLTVTSGTQPFSFLWSNGATTQNLTGLAAGSYVASIVDANNCTTVVSAQVGEPDALALSAIGSTAPCGGSNASIALSVNGGTSPYSFAWSNGSTVQNPTGLAAGEYAVTVSDANGCTAATMTEIGQTEAFSLTPSAIAVACFGGMTGSIQLEVVNGTAPFGFSWSNGSTTQNLEGVGAGSYSVTVTDSNGCTTAVSQSITQPMAALTTTAAATNVACFGAATGSIQLNATGGTAGYTFLWNDGNTSQNRTALPAGNYSATVTDFNGCTTSVSQSISQAMAALTASSAATNVACFGASTGSIQLSASGGTAGYTFLWNDGNTSQNRTALPAGSYSATVTDANGCTTTISQSVSQPAAAVAVTATATPSTSANDGTATASGTGGTQPYSFAWSNGMTGNELEDLAPGTYTVTVSDANGCTSTGSVVVELSNAAGDVLNGVGLKLYPNPASELIVLQAQGILRSDLKLRLVNAAGQVLLEKDFYQGSTICHLQTDTLYDGVYFLSVEDGRAVQTFKVVIMR